MNPLSNEQRRGLRMAAQVACALSLLGAGASLAHAEGAPGAQSESGSALERTADILRVRSNAGGCVPSWGPLSPPAADAALFALFLAEVA